MNIIERPIVTKFGGSSMADAASIRRVAQIVHSDADRRFIVVSAPGRNGHCQEKITDLLIRIHSASRGYERDKAFHTIADRFLSIGEGLGSCAVASDCVEQIYTGIEQRRSSDWFKSRGEWAIARITASTLGATFVDATDLIRIGVGGQINTASYDLVRQRLGSEQGRFVIPGYYGLDQQGEITTFPRGGSDVTGAIIARGVKARVYENWTDVDGVLSANPKVVKHAKVIREITYEEIRELGVRGVEVLQRDTILPLIEAGIPINLRNAFNPDSQGTMIQARRETSDDEDIIGIASEGPFVSFNIQKFGMNDEIGIGRDVLEIFTNAGVPYEHNPSGRDYMSVIVNQNLLEDTEVAAIVGYLNGRINPDRVRVQRDLGLVSLVGQSIQDHATAVCGRLFSGLNRAGIPVRAFDFGTSGISIVVAVSHDRLDDAVRLSHDIFIK